MPKKFSYGQSLLDAKNGVERKPFSVKESSTGPNTAVPRSAPVLKESDEVLPVAKTVPPPVTAIPEAELDVVQHPTAPSEPFGSGLVDEPPEIPPAKQLEFGGSSSSGADETPVEPLPERPIQQGKSKPKPVVTVAGPSGGAGLEGFFDSDDGDDDVVIPQQHDVDSGNPEEGMPPSSQDADAMAKIEREQLEAEIRAKVESEYEQKDTAKKPKTAGKQSVSKKPVSKGVRREDVDMAKLKHIPKCLVERARMAFPDATRQEDAVAAYIYFREGMPADLVVPDEIAAIASNYSGEHLTLGTVKDIVERDILDLKQQNRELARLVRSVELAAAYAVFEAAGFRKGELNSPETLDFLEHGMSDLIKRIETQSELKRQRDLQREGRPIR